MKNETIEELQNEVKRLVELKQSTLNDLKTCEIFSYYSVIKAGKELESIQSQIDIIEKMIHNPRIKTN